jgi:zinc transport system substrate-binding protein
MADTEICQIFTNWKKQTIVQSKNIFLKNHMKKTIKLLTPALLLLMLFGCTDNSINTDGKPKVAATIFPIYDITRQIAGEQMVVINVLDPRKSPHTFELTPSDIIKMQDVQVVFTVSHGLDNWAARISESIGNIEEYPVDKNIELKNYVFDNHEDEEEDEEEHEDEYNIDPHYWLSTANAKIIAGNIKDKLIQIDQENAAYYEQNYQEFTEALDQTRQKGIEMLSNLENNKMIVFHESWNYFAEEFGLEIVGVFEPTPGVQARPQFMKEIYDTAVNNNIKALFSEPQLAKDVVSSVAKDLNMDLYVLDPLGGIEGRNSYIRLMDYNIETINTALKK